MSLTVSPVAVAPPDQLFTEGLKHYNAGEYNRAAKEWESIFPEPAYGPVAYLLLARAKHKAGNHDAAEALIKDFFKKYPNGFTTIRLVSYSLKLCTIKEKRKQWRFTRN